MNTRTGTAIERGMQRRSGQLLATCGLMIATAMQAADGTIVNVILPQMESDLGGGVELGAWVITSYLCATAVVAPLSGWLRRRHGARRVFSSAIIAFVGASLLCSLSSTGIAIIIARVLQGAGAGLILPLAQAILLDIHPKERHGQILAYWGAAIMVGPVIGPALGGIITDLASWRWVFQINAPLGALAVWGVTRIQFQIEPKDDTALDVFGVLFLMIAVGALQLCLERGVGRSWTASPEYLGEGVIAFVGLIGLAVRARRSDFSVLRPDVFKDVNFSLAAFYNFMTSGLLFVAVVFIPALGEGPLGYHASLAGFTIVPRAMLMLIMMLLIGQVISRVDYRLLLAIGWVLMAAGLVLLSNIHVNHDVGWLVVGSTVQALGASMLFTPLSALAFSTLNPNLRTDATGLYSLVRQLGFASGVALMTGLLRARIEAHSIFLSSTQNPGDILAKAATVEAYRDCFLTMAIASVIVAPGVLFFRVQRSATADNKSP
jgi:MFS transporter, DHA2 family, multidrug resistance protein